MLPGIFYAHLREMARISEKPPGVALFYGQRNEEQAGSIPEPPPCSRKYVQFSIALLEIYLHIAHILIDI